MLRGFGEGARCHAFVGSDRRAFDPETEDSSLGDAALSADLFWKRAYQCAWRDALHAQTKRDGLFVKWLRQMSVPRPRAVATAFFRCLYYPDGEDASLQDRRFGVEFLRDYLLEEDESGTARLAGRWMRALLRIHGNCAGYYAPLREHASATMALLFLLHLLAPEWFTSGVHEEAAGEQIRCAPNPNAGLFLQIQVQSGSELRDLWLLIGLDSIAPSTEALESLVDDMELVPPCCIYHLPLCVPESERRPSPRRVLRIPARSNGECRSASLCPVILRQVDVGRLLQAALDSSNPDLAQPKIEWFRTAALIPENHLHSPSRRDSYPRVAGDSA